MIGIKELSRLKSVLLTSGLQQRDPPLYQIINALIDALLSVGDAVDGIISGGGGSDTIEQTIQILGGLDSIGTSEPDILSVPNVQQVVNSPQVTNFIGMNDSESSEPLINPFPTDVSQFITQDFVVMSDGTTPTPSPVDDGFGNFVYVQYTP